MAAPPGTWRLFRAFGIDVFLHWSWAVIALIEIRGRREYYESPFWNIAEYCSIFVIVLLHEFGHALACRSVGGRADRILLWPLGGIAYVDPPPRPGAHLWSIAAGPLVNVLLLIPAWALFYYQPELWPLASESFKHFLMSLVVINALLLGFNMLPIYPLDGGQILRSLLWFVVGPIRSLLAAAAIGLAGAGAGLIWAASRWDIMLMLLALFAASRSWMGFQLARSQKMLSALPRHEDAACPACRQQPPRGDFWGCPCGARFDPFVTQAVCPGCQRTHAATGCVYCGKSHPILHWQSPVRTVDFTVKN